MSGVSLDRRHCSNCGKRGHDARSCREPCSNCGSTDHKRLKCPDLKKKRTVTCTRCGKTGHNQRWCPQAPNRGDRLAYDQPPKAESEIVRKRTDERRIAVAALTPHGLTWTDAMGPSRKLPYTRARADVYAALRRHGWSLKKIALFCGRDHTTVMNALQQKEKSK